MAGLASARVTRADLAYLSACATASMSVVTLGTVELDEPTRNALPDLASTIAALNRNAALLDEAIHLTTAFQAIGYRHVVGTLWEINDVIAVKIAEEFYTALRTEAGALDTDRSAAALHGAARALRDRLPRTPSLWAAYIHSGA